MSSQVLAVVSQAEREKARDFARSVNELLTISDDIAGLAESIGKKAKSLSEIKDEVLEAAYAVFLRSCADPEFEERLWRYAKETGVPARKDTPGGTVVAKIFFTQNKSSARDHSLLLRAACWAEVKPGTLSSGLRTRALVASHLIREFRSAVGQQSPDSTMRPPRLKWDRAILGKLSENQDAGDVLQVTAVREGTAFVVQEAIVTKQ
ncbi:MAG: hypothetical protein ACK4FK_14675 [Ferrovibrio sp.]|uniref:hypothetical protein n=1 Tax=Ferrovibrio sp. TaxID=1917215 RepID=UPI00391D2D78